MRNVLPNVRAALHEIGHGPWFNFLFRVRNFERVTYEQIRATITQFAPTQLQKFVAETLGRVFINNIIGMNCFMGILYATGEQLKQTAIRNV